MDLPSQVEDYNSKDYWEKRFGSEEAYDWLCSYDKYSSILESHLNPSDKILVLGCGNSLLSECLYKAGYKNIVNIDYSETVISRMKKKYQKYTDMQWITMDILDLKFPQKSFDVVLEKATLDAFMVAEKDPWHYSNEIKALIHKILLQVSKNLTGRGKFISITWSQPHFRQKLYSKLEYEWGLQTQSFDAGFEYFMYAMRKGDHLPLHNDTPTDDTTDTEPHRQRINITMEEDDSDFIFKVFNSDE